MIKNLARKMRVNYCKGLEFLRCMPRGGHSTNGGKVAGRFSNSCHVWCLAGMFNSTIDNQCWLISIVSGGLKLPTRIPSHWNWGPTLVPFLHWTRLYRLCEKQRDKNERWWTFNLSMGLFENSPRSIGLSWFIIIFRSPYWNRPVSGCTMVYPMKKTTQP